YDAVEPAASLGVYCAGACQCDCRRRGMILDPRLVPWSDVVPGVGVALVVAAAGFFLWRWRTAALVLLAAAPVAGLAVAMWNLRGSLPSIPPVDATLWVFYFAVGGVVI